MISTSLKMITEIWKKKAVLKLLNLNQTQLNIIFTMTRYQRPRAPHTLFLNVFPPNQPIS